MCFHSNLSATKIHYGDPNTQNTANHLNITFEFHSFRGLGSPFAPSSTGHEPPEQGSRQTLAMKDHVAQADCADFHCQSREAQNLAMKHVVSWAWDNLCLQGEARNIPRAYASIRTVADCSIPMARNPEASARNCFETCYLRKNR